MYILTKLCFLILSQNDVKLDDDDILGSIMEDLHKEASVSHVTPKPMVLTKKHKLNHHSPVQRYDC